MFSGQREFRAIVFSCSISDVKDLLALFPAKKIADEQERIADSTQTFEVFHGFYYSDLALGTPDELRAIKKPQGYKYDFYLAKWQPRRKPTFIVAVPFSRLAEEMFGMLEESLHTYRRKYKKLKLDDFVTALGQRTPVSSCIAASSVQFRVSGSDTVKKTRMTGPDVIASEFYKRTKKSLHGITLKPRRIRFRFDDEAIRFSMETNRHGSFWFRVRKGGVNLPWLGQVLDVLDQENLFEDETGYPLREGIMREENQEDDE